MIRAILFDMDGVLIDAKDWHYEALNKALDLFGLSIDHDAHLATFDGLPTRRKLEIITKSRGLSPKLHDFINGLKQSFTEEIAYARCKPVFQHVYALNRLKSSGYRLAVCSNSIKATVSLMMKLSHLDQFLDLQLSNEDVTRAKPNPEIYQTAMQRFGLLPTECLIVEDNEHGIQAARASGAYVMIVGSPMDVTYEKLSAALQSANVEANQQKASANDAQLGASARAFTLRKVG